MTRFVQANLQRSRAADAILEQLACEVKAQIVIVSEPYQIKTSPSWFDDRLGTVALWIPDSRRIQVLGHGSGDGYVWVKLRHVTAYSVYLSLNYSAEEYRERLEALKDSHQGVLGSVIAAGDFNVRAVEWGMSSLTLGEDESWRWPRGSTSQTKGTRLLSDDLVLATPYQPSRWYRQDCFLCWRIGG